MRGSVALAISILAALAGCSHQAAGVGTPALPVAAGGGSGSPYIWQHQHFHPNWIRIADTAGSGTGITTGPDGRLWASTNDSITRIDYRAQLKVFALPSGSGPQGITAGADGGLWFAAFGSSSIGRLDAHTGVVTMFSVPSGGQPLDIGPGHDGNLWFTEPDDSNHLVGRVTMSGVVTEFGSTTGQATGIAAGPDGDTYFCEQHVGQAIIGRVAPDGTITEKSLGPGNTYTLTAGPDGNVYFIDYRNRTVGLGKVTSGFGLTDMPVPSPIANAGTVGVGPDGNIWLGQGAPAPVRFMIFDIHTQQFLSTVINGPGPAFSYINQFVTGRDGNLWWSGSGYEYAYVYHLITATPSSLTFMQPGQQQTLTASESNFSGALHAYSSNPSVVTVATGNQQNTFTVTSVAPGTAFVRVDDGHFNNLGVPVTVQ